MAATLPVLLDSRMAAASAAAPGAFATLTSIAVADGDGLYEIVVRVHQQGTVDANPVNAIISTATATFGTLPTGATPSESRLYRKLNQGETVFVKTAAAAGGAGSVYVASLILQRRN